MTITTRLTLAMVLMALLTAATVGILTHRNLEAAILPVELSRLHEQVKSRAALIDEVISAARHDVKAFTAGAAALEGIPRARLNGGIDPQDGTTEQVWRARLARRFVSELEAKADYVQFRFIGVADGGREIVRVDRSGPQGSIRIVSDEDLQRKGDQDYLIDTIKLPPGSIHLSRIDLNIEQGEIEEPHLPVIRISTPIHSPQGEPFGIVVLNVDLRSLFARVNRAESAANRVFIVNQAGYFLLHPQTERTFGFQLDRDDRLQTEFPKLAESLGRMGAGVRLMNSSPDGGASGVALAPLQLKGGEWLGVLETAPHASLVATIAPVRKSSVLGGSLVMLLAAGVAVWLARSLARPVVTLTRSVEAFGAGKPLALKVDASGEIGQLSRAFEKMRGQVAANTEALRYSEELFAKSFQLTPECVVISRLSDRTVIRANDALCELWGCTPEEVIGKPAPEFSNWLREDERLGFMRTLVGKGECLNYETPFRISDGRVLRFNLSCRIITFAGEQCILTAMYDVTERRRTEVAAAQLAAIVESSDDAIIGTDLSGVVTSWNAGAEKLFGYSAAEMIGQPIEKLIPVERRREEREILERIRQGGRARPFDSVRLRQNGEAVEVSITISAIKDAAGNVVGASKLARDITDRKLAEAALGASEGRYRTLFEYAPDGIVIANPQSYYLDANTSMCRMLGYSRDEFIGLHASDIVTQTEVPHIGALREIDRTSDDQRTSQYRRKDGSSFSADVIATKMPDGNLLGVIRDITEQKRAEAALQESENRFRTLANSMPQLAWTARAEGHIFWYNQRWYEYTGTTAEQMEGWGWQSVHDPKVLPKVMEEWTDTIKAGRPFEMEFPLRGADGQFRNFLTRVHPMKDPDGNVVQWFGTNTDVETLKRMENSLRSTQERLSSTLAAGSIGTWTWDIRNDRLVADEVTARVFSVEVEAAAKGLPVAAYLEAVVEDDRPTAAAALARAIESCGSYDVEYRVRQKDGGFLWLQARGRVEGDSIGQALRFHGAVMDVTARKLAEATVRESEEHFRFLNDLSEATRTLAGSKEIMSVMARMLGQHLHAARCAYANVAPDGEGFSILHDFTDGCASTVGSYQLSLFGTRAVTTLHRGQTLIIDDVEAELSPTEGADMFKAIGINAAIVCPLVKEGGLRAMMAVHQTTPRIWTAEEISLVQEVVERCWATIERQTAEEKIRQLNAELELRVVERTAQLEAANRELEAFSYSVSHDLRAPLRAVNGFAGIVLEDFGAQLPLEGKKYLERIRNGGQRMGELIDDLLDFARLSRQALDGRIVDTAKLVRHAIDELRPQYEGRSVEFRVGQLAPCFGDAALLKQVWINLLSNAIKYSRGRESAVVEVDCLKQGGEDVYFVRDNGTGFDMKYVHKLFGVFQRLHREDEFEGTGVGLAIVQRIIHRHSGRVWAEAKENRGATFYFTLQPPNPS